LSDELAASAIRNAIALRSPAGTILHSDRGSQFGSKKVRRLLDNNDLVGSMGRVGAACDNAAMESFFSLLQKNVLDTRRWEIREELRLAIVTWIETKYNRRRRQRALGKLTPVEFEMIYTTADAALTASTPSVNQNRGRRAGWSLPGSLISLWRPFHAAAGGCSTWRFPETPIGS
jgi:putative transposase